MFRRFFCMQIVTLTCGWLPLHCVAQDQAGANAGKVYVAFRMEKWQAKHMNDAVQAEKHAETLKTLGCEVKTNAHNGHTDVQCRTVFWKSLAVDSHEKAHQWIDWLQAAGFDTIHGYKLGTHDQAPTAGQRESVQYRLVNWNARHIHDSKELNQLLALYRGLGVEIEMNQHDGHTDLKARCPEWMEIQLPNHAAADGWQAFLKDSGFETKHVH